jgi:ubiquinone/menaquinone biosynthesis C-methylase UbiE
MTRPAARFQLDSQEYAEAIQREAAYWEATAGGAIDTSVATWRDSALSAVTTGDLLERAIAVVLARGTRVLELASGGGGISMRLAREGCTCDGVDVAPGLIEGANQTAVERSRDEHWPGSARFIVGDLNRMTFPPDHYDVVLAHAALHHVQELDHLLGEVRKTLKPGGTLVCVDHMEPSRASLLLRYALLLILPTEVPYWRKPRHIVNRVMARVYRRFLPGRRAPAAFTLPPASPFEDVSGAEAISRIRSLFTVERCTTHLLFADVVAGHLRLGSPGRNVAMARRLRRLDDWLGRRFKLRGQTYFLVARKPMTS